MKVFVAECVNEVNEKCKPPDRFLCVKLKDGSIMFSDLHGHTVVKTKTFAMQNFVIINDVASLFAESTKGRGTDASMDAVGAPSQTSEAMAYEE